VKLIILLSLLIQPPVVVTTVKPSLPYIIDARTGSSLFFIGAADTTLKMPYKPAKLDTMCARDLFKPEYFHIIRDNSIEDLLKRIHVPSCSNN
jgi:hypothetical protein